MKKKPILTVVYLLITLTVVYSVFINLNQSNFSKAENRTLTTTDSIKNKGINEYIFKDFQNTVSNLMKDQFPFKDTLNTVYIGAQKVRGDMINSFSKQSELFLIPVGTVYRISGTNYYINSLVKKDENLETLLNNRIWNYERIYDKYGDKYKMYIYKPVSAEDMPIFGVYDGEECWQQLYGALNERYVIKRQEAETLEDYKTLHYATDHHWNYLGAYQGYEDIINMINNDIPEIGNPYEMTNVVRHEEPFYGSLSIHNQKRLGYDEFVTYDLDFEKDYTIFINDERVEELGSKDDIFNYPDEYMYEGYYGKNTKSIKIVNNNSENNKTILVFGDSYSNSVIEDIAAHFKTTYKIDTRYIYDENDSSNTTFSLDDFLNEHDVDCILWLQFYTSLYFDNTCYLPIKINE